MKKLILILFVQILFSQSLVEFNLDNSYISYDGKHPAHNWTGVSKEIQGSFDLNMKDLTQSKIDLYVPLFSFDISIDYFIIIPFRNYLMKFMK